MLVRLSVVVCAVLLLFAPAAQAHHHHHGGGYYDQQSDPWVDDDATDVDDPTVDATVPVVPIAPVEPAVVAPLPAQQSFPTGPSGPSGPSTTVQDPEPETPEVEYVRTATVAGSVAKLRTDGLAAIPRGAPKRVRTLIAAMNRIVGKPYVWGGGHAKLIDRGYDCSGAVSYGLIGAGLLSSPQVSGTLARFGSSGGGRWVTVFANKGHVYMEVAGLRLDTSAVGDSYGGRSGVRWRSLIGKRRGFAVRHPAGL